MSNLLIKYRHIHKLAHFEKEELSNFLFNKSLQLISQTDILAKNPELLEIENELAKNKPFAYITGKIKFQEIELLTPNGKVLIPRPETEEFCDYVLKTLKKKCPQDGLKAPKILEVGTGSGFISIYLKKGIDADITAIDISKDAYTVANKNFILNNVNIGLFNSSIKNFESDNNFNIIISNPPYIPITYKKNISKSVKDYEPEIALFAENNGLKVYFDIIDFAKLHLNENGMIFFEIFSKKQATDILKYSKKMIFLNKPQSFEIIKDMFGKYRFLKIS